MSDAVKFPLNLARCEFKFAADDVNETTGEFAGYGAVFGNVDSYGDLIAPGAFKSTLSDWRKEQKLPPMLLQHGGWMINDTDALPIGKWTKMEEDSKGLRVEGKLINLDTDLGKRVFGAMKETPGLPRLRGRDRCRQHPCGGQAAICGQRSRQCLPVEQSV